MASVAEIAKKLGLSPATVSRALNPGTAHLVREKTRLRVFAECERINYRPDNSARSLASGKTYKIGMILGDLAGDLGSQLHGISLSAACRKLQENGYNLLILGADNAVERDQTIVNFLRSNVADGYIIGGSIVSDAVYKAVCECDRPVVTTCRELSGHCNLFLRKDWDAACRDIWRRIPDEWRNEELIYCQAGLEDLKYQAVADTAPAGRKIEMLPLRKTINVFSFDRILTTEALQQDLPLL